MSSLVLPLCCSFIHCACKARSWYSLRVTVECDDDDDANETCSPATLPLCCLAAAATKTETNNKNNNKAVVWDLHITSKSKRNNKVKQGAGEKLCKIYKAHDSFIVCMSVMLPPPTTFCLTATTTRSKLLFQLQLSSTSLELRLQLVHTDNSCHYALPTLIVASAQRVEAAQQLLPAIKFAFYFCCYLPTLSAVRSSHCAAASVHLCVAFFLYYF